MPWLDILLYVVAVLLVLVGLAGTLLPALPGIPILYVGLWLAAAVDGYRHVGAVAGWWGSRSSAPWRCCWTSWPGSSAPGASAHGRPRSGAPPIGTFVGLFFGLPGLLLGPFVGALAGELMSGSSVLRSTHVGVGTWIGLLLGTLAKLALSFVMLAMFAFAMLW